MSCHRYAGTSDVRGAERVEDRDITSESSGAAFSVYRAPPSSVTSILHPNSFIHPSLNLFRAKLASMEVLVVELAHLLCCPLND